MTRTRVSFSAKSGRRISSSEAPGTFVVAVMHPEQMKQ
jgi:hypothetical protein